MSGSGVLTIPGFGRPFDLGMLYDCRSDKLVPDVKLWNEENLGKDIISHPYQTSDFSISAKDTIESKLSALGIEPGLRMSFFGGLVPVLGSARYLNDRNTSDHQSRATLIFKCTTKFEELTMSHLGRENVHNPAVFDEGTATHVVTGVTYGARAFFVFDNQLSNKDMEKNIEDELLAMVKALPGMGIDGQCSLRMSENNAKKFDNLQVAFYGDFQPSPSIMSVADAVKLFKDFPSQLLGHKEENAVPVEVWLYPLEKLDSKAARLVREISANLVIDAENCVEEFDILRRRCNDLGRRPACQNFPQIKKKLNKFGKRVKEYKSIFMQQLQLILPKIRGGDEEESSLLQLFVRKEESPFSYRLLKQWLDNCEEKINLMEKYTSCMEVKIATSAGDLDSEIVNPQVRFCVCFSIRFPTKDQLLPEMKKYLLQCNDGSFKPSQVSVSETSLLDQVEVGFARNARRFIDFRLANADRQDISFILAEDKITSKIRNKKITNKLGSSIQLYCDRRLIDGDFKPPSKPGKPKDISRAHDALSISWQRPEEEVITEYRMSYKMFGSSNWLTLTSSSERFDLQDLTAGTSYEVKVAALCEAGSGLYSDVNVIKTSPTNPTSKPNVWPASASTVRIEWERPTIIGKNIVIKSYDIVRRLESDQDGDTWSQCGKTDGNTLAADISLERDTPYRYRIVVNCGSEKSNPSAESDVIIIDKEVLRELRCQSRTIENVYEQPLVFQVPLIEPLIEVEVDSTNMISTTSFSLDQITPP